MVGRPGRSKGCITCIERKVKCDQTRPTCARCRNAFMICDGYRDNGWAFVRSSLGNHAASTKEPRTKEEVADQLQCHSRAHQDSIAGVLPVRNANQERQSGVVLSGGFVAFATPSANLSLSGYREDMWVSYIAQHLFPGPGYKSRSWVLDFIDTDKTLVAYATSCCLGAAFFNGRESDAQDPTSGAVWYGKAIKQLNANLQDPIARQDPVNIAASLLLGLYELAVSSNGSGWIAHAGGVGMLIQARGPHAHRRGLGKRYFMVSRISIISQALFSRRRTFLERLEWMQDTSEESESQRCNTEVFNLFARVPGLLEDADQFMNAPSIILSASLCNAVVQLIADLFVWRWNWERIRPHSAYEVPVDSKNGLTVDRDGPLYETIIFFKEFHEGRQPILYDTALIILLDLAAKLGIYNAPSVALTRLPPYPRTQKTCCMILPHEDLPIQDIVKEILRSVEFHLKGDHFLSGALMLLLPIRVISGFIQDVREKAWLKEVTKKMAREHGWKLSEELPDHTRLSL